jgi:argininosuccinate lyase
MAKIWTKSNQEETTAAKIFCDFTTGNDYQLDDAYFLKYDLEASCAWAEALVECGIYTEDEAKTVVQALLDINELHTAGLFRVEKDDEDGHTAIENKLIALVGDLGKKIHTGRSRNDQSLTMIRMFMTDALREIDNLYTLLSIKLAKKMTNDVFIGYSHTQQAMPITISHYFGNFTEAIKDDSMFLSAALTQIDRCPLGTGAGFGSPLRVNRLDLADKLGFREVQNNSLYCQNSRGKFELIYLNAITQIMLTLQRMANDMVLYTSREYGLFKMSDSLSQGSSMMPQKKNPDVFEMIRAKTADIFALEERVKFIIKGLPSGYNRDLQEIKACIVDAYNISRNCIYIMTLAMDHIEADHGAIADRLQKDIVAADYAINKCVQDPSLNFRDVYKESTENLQMTPIEAVKLRKSKGSPFNQ